MAFRDLWRKKTLLSRSSGGNAAEKRLSRRGLRLEPLERRELLAAMPIISEFLASNDRGLEDVDGDDSDWIEIHNAGDAPADLEGWFLTDDAEDLTKWQFPAVTVHPGGYLLVFASDKDRTDPAAELHTNFKIAAEGEYLALVEPDGSTVVHDFAPAFPPQVVDTSYGLEMSSTPATFVAAGSTARYLVPPSGVLGLSWTQLGFNDNGWSVGNTGIGYENSGNDYAPHLESTVPSGTTSFYVRQTFTIDDPSAVSGLSLGVRYDDGFAAYLNGQLVAARNAPASPQWNSTATGFHDDNAAVDFEEIDLAPFVAELTEGTNVLAIHALNQNSGSSDLLIEARLTGAIAGEAGDFGYLLDPTPGVANGPAVPGLGPIAGDVTHAPFEPTGGQAVTVTAAMSDVDGVDSVALEYQVVDPGNYVALDDPAYQTNWTSLTMRDDGTGADATSGDGVYTAVVPASVQEHRHLVRYRIRAVDGDGFESLSPNIPEASPNYAYFVYDGVPDWTGSVRPGVRPPVTYSSDLLTTVPVYHLITKHQDVLDSQFHPGTTRGSGYGGSEYLWEGTLVYDGVVYDHIRYRARGGVWRYAMGKNMWKFAFNNSERFQAYDNYGRPYDELWDNLNFSAIIQQGDFQHRGEQGLFEAVGFRLFQLAGVEASNTNYVHFRVIDEAQETGSSQFQGDFWGLYMTIEQLDERLLDEHGLPDSSIFKMEGGTGPGGIGGVLKHQAVGLPGDYSDLQQFKSTYESRPPIDWWRENVDLDRYYSYRSIVEAIHHYDIGYGKNYYYLHNSETDKWQVHPWDLDLTWANNMFGNGDEPFRSRALAIPELAQEYRNRLREIRDLLYNPEQTGMLIDEIASVIYTPGEPSLVDADRAMWDFNPILVSGNVNPSKAGHGRYYQVTPSRDFAGMIQLMKNYVQSRGSYIDFQLLGDRNQVPDAPSINYTGGVSFPVDALTFEAGAFDSPVGASFDAIQWRIAEVTDPDAPDFDPTEPRKYEIEANWQSEPLDDSGRSVTISAGNLQPGRLYRVRARMLDDDGRWSRWSEPVEFTAGDPLVSVSDYLRIAEINYHPHDADPGAGELPDDDNEFEFIELVNTSAGDTINLNGVQFVEGIQFDFSEGAVTQLGPGERLVLVRNLEAFQSRYGSEVLVAGEYSGALANNGELLRIVDVVGATIQEFTYGDSGSWPDAADGLGYTLVVVDTAGDYDAAENWRQSAGLGGSPGAAEPIAGIPGDYNGSGLVEQGDLDLVLGNWGQSAASVPSTWVNDLPTGIVDQSELDGVLSNWGSTSAALATVQAQVTVPVPLRTAERDGPLVQTRTARECEAHDAVLAGGNQIGRISIQALEFGRRKRLTTIESLSRVREDVFADLHAGDGDART